MSAPASPPLVWITQGRTQHAAFVLEESNNGRKRVLWATTRNTDWIDGSVPIERELTPRRRQRPSPIIATATSPVRKAKKPRRSSPLRKSSTLPATNARRISLDLPVVFESERTPKDAATVTTNTKHSTDDARQDSDSDDSSIEVLLTILPPSPQNNDKSKLSTDSQQQQKQPPKEISVHSPLNEITEGKKDEYPVVESHKESAATENERGVSVPGSSVSNTVNDDSIQLDSCDGDNGGSREFTTESSDSTTNAALRTVTDNDVRDSSQMLTESSSNPEDDSSVSLPCPLMKDSHSSNHSSSQRIIRDDDERKPAALVTTTPANDDTASKNTDSISDESKPYTFVSSAYIQNLAEICYTILEDRRWRVGLQKEQLLAWHIGDDLTAVVPLARRYRPMAVARECKPRECHGVLCSCQETEQAQKSVAGALAEENQTTQPKQDLEDTPEDRALYLYTRLFYRKGPWFRMDDVYSRYYAPKQIARSNPTGNRGTDRLSRNNKAQPKQDKQSFFRKRSTATSPLAEAESTLTASNATGGSLFNEEIFQDHLKALKLLLEDIHRLKSMGLIRNFRNEEECGKTVGNARVILTTEERRQVLLKLGCRKNVSAANSQKRKNSAANVSDSKRGDGSSSSAGTVENEIWKQMCQQQSISTQFMKRSQGGIKGSQKNVLLPVSRHVNLIMLDNWVTSIVHSCSLTDYVAASLMKARKAHVKNTIAKIIGQLPKDHHPAPGSAPLGSGLDTALSGLAMCIRLRETPLTALQRCARLFLCATSGPGEMRSDGGANGWKSIREVDRNAVIANTKLKNSEYARSVDPPGAHSWHNVSYPGLTERFGIASFPFRAAYEFRTALAPSFSQGSSEVREQIFYSQNSFRAWEMAAEVRSNADYLIELNDLLLYNERKVARDSVASGNENVGQIANRRETKTARPVDFLGLMTPDGRKTIVNEFLAAHRGASCHSAQALLDDIEQDTLQLLYSDDASHCTRENQGRRLKTEYEDILCTLGLLLKNILSIRAKEISNVELNTTISRPWLRHLSWDACLAYVLWDIIPILERRGYYRFAIQSLELLIHGSASSLEKLTKPGPGADFSLQILSSLDVHIGFKEQHKSVAFAHSLLSRRARGKALDRLMIDLTHLLRHENKSHANSDTKKKSTKKTEAPATIIQGFISKLSYKVLENTVLNASVSFSSIRTLARRLKQPLSKSLELLSSQEAKELGLRLANSEQHEDGNVDTNKYSDWVPITDHAVANSVAIEDSMVGRRCSFVGHEDDVDESTYNSTLNVEQLAMEFYRSGRLPEKAPDKDDHIKGGWVGWHDEGGMVRTLFRVMCFDIIGMDWRCTAGSTDNVSYQEHDTIHLSPYQGAPFDLHVGYELAQPIILDGSTITFNRGFYLRRKAKLDVFLLKLERMSSQEISDVVWQSIAARRKYMVNSCRKDPNLEKDVLQTRTLSMLAAGFGGKMLAAMFRCFFFDYRHYSGGLPDLLLVRARYDSPSTLVDLGDFIGEAFDKEYLAQLETQQRAALLGDRDDDFLGCSKVGDSGGGGGRGVSRNRTGRQNKAPHSKPRLVASSFPEMPQKLDLAHDGRKVDIECMFVEVKSVNDRLDARQEDWLNILDRFGNARVCKFVDGKDPKTKPRKAATAKRCLQR